MLAVEHWASILALWPEFGEDTYVLCCEALRDPNAEPPEWRDLAAALCERGLARRVGSKGARLVFVDAHREALLRTLEVRAGADATRCSLVEAWLRSPVASAMSSIARWARELGLWAELSRMWLVASHRRSFGDLTEIIPFFAGLPDEARRDHPVLSLAGAVASGRAVGNGTTHPWSGREIVRDGFMFHSRWRSHTSNESAIIAGALWILVQRQLPGQAGAAALDGAEATKAAVLERVATSRAGGDAPSEYALQLVHIAAAEVSLALDDLSLAAAESDIATILGGGPLRTLGSGMRSVARELMGQPSGPDHNRCASPRLAPVSHTRPLHYPTVLASGMRGLATLDSDAVAAALARVPDSPEIGAPYVALRAWLDALNGALWGDAEVALSALDSVEHRAGLAGGGEPLTCRLLTGARIQLLAQLGAQQPVDAAIATLSPPEQWVHRSRALLWAGDGEQAAATASAGIFDLATPPIDRKHLLSVKAAALLIDRGVEPASRAAALHAAARYTIRAANYLPLALLPTSIGTVLLEQFEADPEWPSTGGPGHDAKGRFAALSRRTGPGWPYVHLTSREVVLLPLLATPATIPEIAHSLGVSVHTVRKQVATLRAKFSAPTRAELVRRAGQIERTPPTS